MWFSEVQVLLSRPATKIETRTIILSRLFRVLYDDGLHGGTVVGAVISGPSRLAPGCQQDRGYGTAPEGLNA